ncbi:hypothetical protein PTSG_03511 [Salpingoeca rosetta]|uniref:AAA+ ATPase domain-containing protein n=1 Tax=Salpingoeca rosetta (strain ATCC 50818 / BSB-021) TaxID=946362 RepID=F2U5U0_SALR5|nr:uncharacterized protein PTSG_03511 [Salpingoeca rosetta]EGD82881.1 hypothetical protein PTSG_03511 [Salpingoeca rosetta]|eukprot:XP_004995245.1 hypothetical protein PTSG_03511 [Salpingoeca rosetta]
MLPGTAVVSQQLQTALRMRPRTGTGDAWTDDDRCILVTGASGTGKTTWLRHFMTTNGVAFEETSADAFFTASDQFAAINRRFKRAVERGKQARFVWILDNFEMVGAKTFRSIVESHVKAHFLDALRKFTQRTARHNTYIVAVTSKPDQLDERLQRFGQFFHTCIELSAPTARVRREIVEMFLQKRPSTRDTHGGGDGDTHDNKGQQQQEQGDCDGKKVEARADRPLSHRKSATDTWQRFSQDLARLIEARGHGFKAGDIQAFLQQALTRNSRIYDKYGRCAGVRELAVWLHKFRGTLPSSTVPSGTHLSLADLCGCCAVKRQLWQYFLTPLAAAMASAADGCDDDAPFASRDAQQMHRGDAEAQACGTAPCDAVHPTSTAAPVPAPAPVSVPLRRGTAHASVRPSHGILLHGPSGTGKTSLCLATAAAAGLNVIHVLGSNIRSKIVGESEAAVAKVFRDAANCRPCVLLVDQLESICGKHSEDDRASQRLTAAFVRELDAVHANADAWASSGGGVYVLATTQDVNSIDPVVLRPGRVETLVRTTIPTAEERREMLDELIWNTPLQLEDDTFELRDDLVDMTAGFSHAEIAQVFQEAGMAALRQWPHFHDADDLHVRGRHLISCARSLAQQQH